jgi:hypothetical protein
MISEKIMGTSKFIRPAQDADADVNAKHNIRIMLEGGRNPQMTPNMNLRRHLELYKQELTRWAGREEQNPNVQILQQVIAQIEAQIASQAQGTGQVQAQATPANESQVRGDITGGVLGGV